MRETNSLLGGGDTFDIFNPSQPFSSLSNKSVDLTSSSLFNSGSTLPKNTISPVPLPKPAPVVVYKTPSGEYISNADHYLTNSLLVTAVIAFILGLIIVFVYILCVNYSNLHTLPNAEIPTQLQIQNYMQSVLQGTGPPGTASGFVAPSDCQNPYNNCVYTASTNAYNCVLGGPTNETSMWYGMRCQLPLITPYIAAVVDPDHSGYASMGTLISSGNGTPYDVQNEFATNSDVLLAVYDLRPGSTYGDYSLYSTYLTSKSLINVTNVGELTDPDNFSQSLMIIFRNLQVILYQGSIQISTVASPSVADFINGTNTVKRITAGNSTTFSSQYALWNANTGEVLINTNGVTSQVYSSFIPLTNLSSAQTTITFAG